MSENNGDFGGGASAYLYPRQYKHPQKVCKSCNELIPTGNGTVEEVSMRRKKTYTLKEVTSILTK